MSLLLLLSPTLVSANSTSQPLNLQLQGIITNAGNQSYRMSGGQVVSAFVNGLPVIPQGTQLDYSLNAQVTGLQTTGQLTIHLTEVSPSRKFDLRGTVDISGSIPATVFPVTVTSTGDVISCTANCNSQIPLLFTGLGSFTLTNGDAQLSGGNHQSRDEQQSGDKGTTINIPFAIESAYWNPFGGSIVLTSLDSATSPSIIIIANYKSATIEWTGVHVDGQFAGLLGSSTQASGLFSLQTRSSENLFTGVERDRGTIVFSNTTPAILTASGEHSGTTFIPKTNTVDCSPFFQLPEGTCTFTGAFSTGTFRMTSPATKIRGSYDTIWSVPSLLTMTTVIASVSGVGSD